MQALTFNVSGLKCDNPECNYKDETIQYSEYKNYINYPCPCCGSPLLTKKDYRLVKRFELFTKIFNKVFRCKENSNENLATIKYEFNGTGKATIKEIIHND